MGGGLLDFIKTPEGMGLLSAVAGGLSGARRGTPFNNIGRGLLAGVGGYGQALEQQKAMEASKFAMAQKQAEAAKMQAQQDMMRGEYARLAQGAESGQAPKPNLFQLGASGATNETLKSLSDVYAIQAGGKKSAFREALVGANNKPVIVSFDENGNRLGELGEKPDMLNAYQAERLSIARQDLALAQENARRGAAKQNFDMGIMPGTELPNIPPPAITSTTQNKMGGPLPPGFPGQAAMPAASQAPIPPAAGEAAITSPQNQAFLNNKFGTPEAGRRWRADGTSEVIPGGSKDKGQSSSIATAENVISTVDDALKLVGWNTAGPGAMMRGVYGTEAKALDGALTTIKANLGFDRLQQMRDSSPTGGALGSVAVQELTALQSAMASLDQGQDSATLKKSLGKVKTHYNNWLDTMKKAGLSDGGKQSPNKKTTPTQIKTAADYAKIPSGAEYIAPDGTTRRKP